MSFKSATLVPPKMTNIPDPYCPRCDGVGWYEGGVTIQTYCPCLRPATMEDAQRYVVHGTIDDWITLYQLVGGKVRGIDY